MRKVKLVFCTLGALLGSLTLVTAQPSGSRYVAPSSSLQRQVADLTQEVYRLQQELGRLRLSFEEQRRENAQLRQEVGRAIAQQQRIEGNYAELSRTLDAQIKTLRRADQSQEEAIIAEVSRQIRKLAAETQAANAALAQSLNRGASNAVSGFTFSEDYPQQGISYAVRPGDTLSQIAHKHNATVRDIQNANKIADPKTLRAGQTLFIPQAQ